MVDLRKFRFKDSCFGETVQEILRHSLTWKRKIANFRCVHLLRFLFLSTFRSILAKTCKANGHLQTPILINGDFNDFIDIKI